MMKNEPCRTEPNELQGVLTDINTSNIISCGRLLDVLDMKGHLVAKIDVATATIESKKGLDSTKSQLDINNFFAIKKRNIMTIVTRIGDKEYVCDSYIENDITD